MISNAKSATASATARLQVSQPTLRIHTAPTPQGDILDIASLGDLRVDHDEAYGHNRSGTVTRKLHELETTDSIDLVLRGQAGGSARRRDWHRAPTDPHLGHTGAALLGLALVTAASPALGQLSDRIGRKPLLAAGTLALLVLTVPAYLLICRGGPVGLLFGYLLVGSALSFMVLPSVPYPL